MARSSTTTALALIMGLTAALLSAPSRSQVLQVAVDASPAGLDPHIITAFSSFQVVNGSIYEGLTGIDKDLRIVPALAQTWTISPDGKSYVFKLVSGATMTESRWRRTMWLRA